MEEQRVVRLSTLDQPLHSGEDVGTSWNLAGVAGIIREHDDVFRLVSVSLYSDQQSFVLLFTAAHTDKELLNVVRVINTPRKSRR